MTRSITTTFVYDFAQWKEARRRNVWPSARWFNALIIVYVVARIGSIVLKVKDRPLRPGFLAVFAAAIAVGFAIRYFENRSRFRGDRDADKQVSISVSPEGVKKVSPSSSVDYRWEARPAAILTKKGIVLLSIVPGFVTRHPDPNHLWLPASGFATPSDYTAACERVKANVKVIKDRR